MSLSVLKKFLSTYTPNQPTTQHDVREVTNRVLQKHQLPKLEVDEKVFIRGNVVIFSSCTSVRAYEVHHIQQQLIKEMNIKQTTKTPIIGVRFL